MSNRCYICGGKITNANDLYHTKCMKKLFSSNAIPVLNYTQDELNNLAKSIIANRISVTGVQPKLSLHLEKENKNSSRLTLVGLEGDYILKVPTVQWKYLVEAEHFCMLFAKMCKIPVAEFGLIPLKSGELAYITRRMDRTKTGNLHMEDFCQITDKLTSHKYNGSMEQVGKAIRKYSSVAGLDLVKFFELTLFCFLTGNSDMHLKNFSLIQNKNYQWQLSSAYDLVPVKIIMPSDNEELALSLDGKKSNLKRQNFYNFAKTLGLSEMQFERALNNLLKRTQANINIALECSFLPYEMQESFSELFTERHSRLLQ